MVATLLSRRDALEAKIAEKTAELKTLCLAEAELTGLLPPETPLLPGEPPPIIRKRVGTSFSFPQSLINNLNNSEGTLGALELECKVQTNIAEAALTLANDPAASKAVRRKHRLMYRQSQRNLTELETRLDLLKQGRHQPLRQQQIKKKPRPNTLDHAHLIREYQSQGLVNGSWPRKHGVDGYEDLSGSQSSNSPRLSVRDLSAFNCSGLPTEMTMTSSLSQPNMQDVRHSADVRAMKRAERASGRRQWDTQSAGGTLLPNQTYPDSHQPNLNRAHSLGSVEGQKQRQSQSKEKEWYETSLDTAPSPPLRTSSRLPTSARLHYHLKEMQIRDAVNRSMNTQRSHPSLARAGTARSTPVDELISSIQGGHMGTPPATRHHLIEQHDKQQEPRFNEPYRFTKDVENTHTGTLAHSGENVYDERREWVGSVEDCDSVDGADVRLRTVHEAPPSPTHSHKRAQQPQAYETMEPAAGQPNSVVQGNTLSRGNSQMTRQQDFSGSGGRAHERQYAYAPTRANNDARGNYEAYMSARVHYEPALPARAQYEAVPPARLQQEQTRPVRAYYEAARIQHEHSVPVRPQCEVTLSAPLQYEQPGPVRAQYEPMPSRNEPSLPARVQYREAPVRSQYEAGQRSPQRVQYNPDDLTVEAPERPRHLHLPARRAYMRAQGADTPPVPSIQDEVDSAPVRRESAKTPTQPYYHTGEGWEGREARATPTVPGLPEVHPPHAVTHEEITFDTVVPFESPQNHTVVQAGIWQPYREVTKPFEMSDFYKYSTKFRHARQSPGQERSPGAVQDATAGTDTPPVVGVYQPLRPMTCQPVERRPPPSN